MPQPVTLKELAQLLNLAPSTVSKALKGHKDISETTKKKVRELADQIHYQPNALAKSLRNRQSHSLAVILPTLKEYFFIQLLRGILEFAYHKRYKLIVYETGEQYEKEAEICYSLIKSGLDGLLIAPTYNTIDTQHFKSLIEGNLPLVFLGRTVGNIKADRVLEDDFQGAWLAVNHMIKSGCKRIAHFSAPQQWLWAQKRQLGYLQSLRDHHFPINRNLIVENYPPDQIISLIKNLIQHFHIDGIFAINDRVAIKIMLILQKLGYIVPQDIAICGFGNDPSSQFTSPELTTVENKGLEIGRIATELLINRIEKKIERETLTKILPHQIIIRQSTGKTKNTEE